MSMARYCGFTRSITGRAYLPPVFTVTMSTHLQALTISHRSTRSMIVALPLNSRTK